jgi:hypothetical protein
MIKNKKQKKGQWTECTLQSKHKIETETDGDNLYDQR